MLLMPVLTCFSLQFFGNARMELPRQSILIAMHGQDDAKLRAAEAEIQTIRT